MPTDPSLSAATPEQWRAAYEAKIADLARETQRTTTLNAVVRRMYDALAGWGKDAGYQPHQVRRFFLNGFPSDERDALLAALPDMEREWVLTGASPE